MRSIRHSRVLPPLRLALLLALAPALIAARADRLSLAGGKPGSRSARFAIDARLETIYRMQSGDRFVIAATLSAASNVCYADTIFRDGFDATGL
jgi:hypothetical protein